MENSSYVPIHNHDAYSYGDAITSTEDLILAAKKQNCPAVNLANHGNLASIMEFADLAKKHDIKPIIGSEMYYAKAGCEKERKSNHLLVNVRNELGYKNLLKLMYWASVPVEEGGAYFARPRINEELLFEHQEGLIVSSACVAGPLNEYIINGDMTNAILLAERFKDNLEHFFLEIMPHRFPLQEKCNIGIVEIAKRLDIPLLLTTDAHYPDEDHHEAYKINTRSNRGGFDENYDDEFLPHPDLYIKNLADIEATLAFAGIPGWAIDQAIENTYVYNKLVEFQFEKPKFGLPHISDNADKELQRLVEIGLIRKFGARNNIPKEYIERAKHELRVIRKMGYSDYFLILHDFISAYKSKPGRIVGPGRGSACGSILLYILGITQVDSLMVGLPFERFLNEERISPPDVDIDLIPEYRDEVKEYLRDKYGKDHVIDIGNHAKKKPRMALTDVGRVLGMEVEAVKEITKLIPDRGIDEDDETVSVDLNYAMEMENIAPYVEKYPKLFDIARKLEGTFRSQGKHAAGICITPLPIYDCVPVTRREGVIISQWDKKQLESIGIQKFDLLGLATLSILSRCVEMTNIQLGDIPLDDEKTWDYICAAKNMEGIFQFNSNMMKGLLREIKPRNLEELAHVNAIGRPAVLDAGLHDIYIKNKNAGEFDFPFDIPEVREILSKTNGVVVFQEQVMYISKAVAGFSLGKGDLLRRNFEKYGTPKDRTPKVVEEYEKYKKEFIEGMEERGYSSSTAEQFFDWLGNSVGYSFTYNHSYPYSLIGYWTAYYKANFPAVFYVANLNDEKVLKAKDNKDEKQTEKFVKEAKSQGIKILRPNFEHSYANCAVVNSNTVVLGLRLLKGVGGEVSTLFARSNGTLESFIEWFCTKKKKTQDGRFLNIFNKGHLTALMSIGYFDCLNVSNEHVWELYQKKLWELENKKKYDEWLEKKNAGRKVREFKENPYRPEEMPNISEGDILGFNLDNNLDKVIKDIDPKYLDEAAYVLGEVKGYKSGEGKWGIWRMVTLQTQNGIENCFLQENIIYKKGQILAGNYRVSKKGSKTIVNSRLLKDVGV